MAFPDGPYTADLELGRCRYSMGSTETKRETERAREGDKS